MTNTPLLREAEKLGKRQPYVDTYQPRQYVQTVRGNYVRAEPKVKILRDLYDDFSDDERLIQILDDAEERAAREQRMSGVKLTIFWMTCTFVVVAVLYAASGR